jgi:predicted nucleic acid-binding protein
MPKAMIDPVYVIDTQALVRFTKGFSTQIGREALSAMLSPKSRIVVPTYVLQEVAWQFGPRMSAPKNILIPPTALLRLLRQCANVRLLDRGSVVLAREFQLRRENRFTGIPDQDVPIAAAAVVVREYYAGPVFLITCDRALKKWAPTAGINIVWNNSGRQ